MTRDSVLDLFDKLNVWSRGDQRAPHKPLLVLYALGRWSRGETADIPFKDVDADLTVLLKEFGPPRQSYHPEYPFWQLQNDGVWAVHATGPLMPRQGSTDAKKSALLANDAAGRFSPEVRAALQADPCLVTEIAGRLLENCCCGRVRRHCGRASGAARRWRCGEAPRRPGRPRQPNPARCHSGSGQGLAWGLWPPVPWYNGPPGQVTRQSAPAAAGQAGGGARQSVADTGVLIRATFAAVAK
jgi:putative restriction endonuclease